MSYLKACNFLKSTARLGSRPGLDTITRLCALLDNPQDKLAFIHVAGTNGKGSTCKMLASIAKESGYKTGLFVSPFFEDYRDSFYINGKIMSKTAFGEIVDEVQKQAQRMALEGQGPTEFEILTACAFLWFLWERCQLVILETGMGGRLDATNVISNSVASVITAIDFDHTAYLGDTLQKIATEKCGIVKQDSILTCYPNQPKEALEIIRSTAAAKNCLFIQPQTKPEVVLDSLLATEFKYCGTYFKTAMPGTHQVRNAITAIETMRALNEHTNFKFPMDAIKKGLEGASLPARQEIISKRPLILLDGAHNLQGIEALCDSVKKYLSGRRIIVVMGMLNDKQYEQSIEIMAKLCSKFIAALPNNPRALAPAAAAQTAAKYCRDVSCFDEPKEALGEAVRCCGSSDAIVICGSLYLANKMREFLKDKNFICQSKGAMI